MKIIAFALCLVSFAAVAQTKSKAPVKSQGHISAELLKRKTERYNCRCRPHAKVQTATEKKPHES